jgi:hypothetical protein
MPLSRSVTNATHLSIARLRRADGLGVLVEQLVDGDATRIDRFRLERLQHQQRHDHGARPVRDLVDVEGKPLRQQHDLDRHHRHALPRHHAIKRKQRAGEHVRFDAAAARQDRLARAPHVRRVDVVADHLEREVGLHAGAHVELARVKQRPAAMRTLDAAQIDADLALQLQRGIEFVPRRRRQSINRGIAHHLFNR